MSLLPDLSALRVKPINYEDTTTTAESSPEPVEDEEIPEDELEQPEKSPDILRRIRRTMRRSYW